MRVGGKFEMKINASKFVSCVSGVEGGGCKCVQ